MKLTHTFLVLALASLAVALPHQETEGEPIDLMPRREGKCCETGTGAQRGCRFYSHKKTCSIYKECDPSLCT